MLLTTRYRKMRGRTMSINTVPIELAVLGQAMLAKGFVLSGGTYSTPKHGGWRLNVAYAHREATLRVSSCVTHGSGRSVWIDVERYRGEHPLKWAQDFFKNFPGFPDNPLEV